MSLPPNWTPDGTEPDSMHHIPLRPDRARASRPVMVPTSLALIGLRACSIPLGPMFARELWAAPSPSRALTGTGVALEPVRIESAGRRAPMCF